MLIAASEQSQFSFETVQRDRGEIYRNTVQLATITVKIFFLNKQQTGDRAWIYIVPSRLLS